MIDNALLKKQQVGRDGFFWWMGQVVHKKNWIDNQPKLPEEITKIPGFKRRVKVRIFGYHTADLEALPDEQLPWAYCLMPVTAGGASGGMSNSVNFSGGEFVFGFFLDGEDSQQPIVLGVFDKSAQINQSKSIPKIGFTPFSGYTNGLVESLNNVKESGTIKKSSTSGSVSRSKGVSVNKTIADESAVNEAQSTDVKDQGDKAAHENAKITGEVKPANKCADDNPAAGIKLALSRVQKQVAFIKEQQGLMLDPLTLKIGNIQKEMDRASENISGYVKDIMDKVRAVTTKKMAEVAAKASIKLPIAKMETFKKALDKQLDGLGCAFENIMGGLKNTLNGLLSDMMGKVTGFLDCVVNDVIGNMLDSALGAINQVTNSISGILDSLTGGIDAIKLPLVEAGNFIASLKGMFTCESDTNCADVAQVSMLGGNLPEAPSDFMGLVGGALGGGGLIPEPVGGILKTASSLKSSITGVVDAVEDIGNNVSSAVDNISGAMNVVSGLPGQLASGLQGCNPFANTCEPPLAVIFGGGVVAQTANAIINQAGEIIGVDTQGSTVEQIIFGSKPSLNFTSNCGQGGGASGTVEVNPVTVGVGTVIPFEPTREKNVPDGYVLKKIVMDSPGTNYPPAPDGSVGGSGGVYANASQTIVRTADGDHQVIDPDMNTCFPAGSTVFIPSGGAVELPPGTVDQQGNDASGYQNGRGLTEGNGFVVSDYYCLITPTPEVQDVMTDPMSYDVVMELDEINILQTGIAYNPGDTVCIEGDGNKICVEPTLSEEGCIIDVPLTDRGLGFTSIPIITINTETGAAASLHPYLRIKYRGRDNIDQVLDQVTQDQIVSVVDCVGKFNV